MRKATAVPVMLALVRLRKVRPLTRTEALAGRVGEGSAASAGVVADVAAVAGCNGRTHVVPYSCVAAATQCMQASLSSRRACGRPRRS